MGEDREVVVQRAIGRLRGSVSERTVDLSGERLEEQVCLLEGMLRGWARLVLPRILAEYDVVRVEGEVIYDFLGCRLGAKPDVLLRRRGDGTLWYVEWKTTSTLTPEYFQSWTKAVQLHAGALGVSRSLGEDIAGAIVFALYKGFWSKQRGRQESIFCHGYGARGAAPENVELEYTYRAGLIKYPILDVKKWVEEMPLDVLEAQFGDTGPVFLDERLCESWLRQTSLREAEIDRALDLLYGDNPTGDHDQEVLDRYFPQNFDECTPTWGSKCDFCDFCHVKAVGERPLESGIYVLREPHHTTDPVWEVIDDNDR